MHVVTLESLNCYVCFVYCCSSFSCFCHEVVSLCSTSEFEYLSLYFSYRLCIALRGTFPNKMKFTTTKKHIYSTYRLVRTNMKLVVTC